MRNVLLALMLCMAVTTVSAQEVYTSSGKPGYQKKTKREKGYDPDKLIVGGGLNAGFSNGYMNLGISPIVGYRITKNFSAGIGLGYQFYKAPAAQDPNNPDKLLYLYQNIIYPSVWTRYFIYKNFFMDLTYEYDFISLKYPLDRYGNVNTVKSNVNNSCLLVGAGIRQPLGGRVSAYVSLVYDVLQGEYSPYPRSGPDLRFGIVAGL
jgi:hypothetical protein